MNESPEDRELDHWLTTAQFLERCTFADTGEPCGVKE